MPHSLKDDKFTLTLEDGRSVIVRVDAVKNHIVVDMPIGQVIVEVRLDRNQISEELASVATKLNSPVQETSFYLSDPNRGPESSSHGASMRRSVLE